MKSKWIRKDVFDLTIPIFMEQLFVISLGMINTMMAGHIGKEAVSAIGMVDSVNNIFISFFSALAVGGTVIVAQFIGLNNIKKANEAMKQALYTSLIISIIITIIMFIFKMPLIHILFGAANPLIIHDASIYIEITLLTYPLITIDLVANGILRGAGDTKTPMKITIFMNIINVFLSYIFINVFEMGILGAALGIAIARVTGGIIIMVVIIRGSKLLKLKNFRQFKFNPEYLKPIFEVGIPASIESLLFNGGKLITQIFIVDMGTVAMASNTIVNSIATLMNVPGNSLCIAATALIGQNMGKRETKEAEKLLWYITKLATVALTLVGLMFLPISGLITRLYSTNSAILNMSTILLRINCLFIPTWAISFVLPSGLKGAGDGKYTMVTAMIGMWIFRIIFGYVLGVTLGFGIIGVWFGMYIDWSVRGILYVFRFKSKKWENHILVTA